jgi:hypothetical protein
MKKMTFISLLFLTTYQSQAQLSPVTVYEVMPQNIKFLKPKNVALGGDSLYLTVFEMYLNLPQKPQKFIFDFPDTGVSMVYLVSDEPVSSINRYRENAQLYTELSEPTNGRYMLTICTNTPIKMLKEKMRVVIDGKPTFVGKVNKSQTMPVGH